MDASAIMQNDAKVENVRAMTDFTLDYGAYSRTPSSAAPPPPTGNRPAAPAARMPKVKPGVCYPWEKKLAELPALTGDAALAKRVWEEVDSLAYFYIWHLVLSF